PFELDGERHLVGRGHVGEAGAPQVELHRLDAVGLGQAGGLVGLGEGGVVAGLGHGLGQCRGIEGAAVGEALAPVAHDPHAHAHRVGHGELLHRALVHPHLRVARPGHVGLDLLVALGHAHQPVGHVQQVEPPGSGSHAAVPPTVSAETRRVGTPSPTGTPWPSLPHVPGCPMAKSLPTASMSPSTLGPLPMRLPSRSGSVILPSSIRYASVMPNTKSPLAVLTCPPPSDDTYTPRSVEATMSAGSSWPPSR